MMAFGWMILIALAAAAGDEPQAKPAPPAAPAQDADRPVLSAVELKALRDNNIFSPKTVKRIKPPTGPRKTEPPAQYHQKPPMVTGIFLDPKTQAPQAIVEDKNDSTHRYFKEPKFMKVGDEWAGIKLESLTQDKAVFIKGSASKDVRIGETLPETDEKPTSALADPGDDAVADDGEIPPGDAPASKIQKMSTRPESSRPETKALTPEAQSRTLEDMKKRLKKRTRPGDNEE
jgi:hypothetical protein